MMSIDLSVNGDVVSRIQVVNGGAPPGVDPQGFDDLRIYRWSTVIDGIRRTGTLQHRRTNGIHVLARLVLAQLTQ